jgi:hypothetical protein
MKEIASEQSKLNVKPEAKRTATAKTTLNLV